MGGPGQAVARVWEAHTVHPATTSSWSLACSSRPSRLEQHLSKWHLAAPGSWAGLLLHLLNVGWKHSAGKNSLDVNTKRIMYNFTMTQNKITPFLKELCNLYSMQHKLSIEPLFKYKLCLKLKKTLSGKNVRNPKVAVVNVNNKLSHKTHTYTSMYPFEALIPAFEVTGSSGQQDIIGMPVQAEDSGAYWLLDVLTHPPVGNNTESLVVIIKCVLFWKSFDSGG